ncbi:polysaccharide pyruvyl transferase family protein [Chitinophagales bacterium]|nr:polysaccharide pyruvyl transferase family protein [Chitinophagales bacterium]
MKFGLLNYSLSYNVGDQVQSLAAKQFLPQVDYYIDRDNVQDAEKIGEEVKVIMNGWWMSQSDNWPPPENIIPLFVSFHITTKNKSVENLTSKESIDYLKKHEPIGCRDYFTRDLLRSKGVNAYFSGCLTLTLGETYKRATQPSEDVYLVDVLYRLRSYGMLRRFNPLNKRREINTIQRIISPELYEGSKYIIQDQKSLNEEDKFALADQLLKGYAQAKLVVTSRIHCALPSVGIGTPVVFIEGGLKESYDANRLNGISDYFNHYYFDYSRLNHPLSPVKYENLLDIPWDNLPQNPDNSEVVHNLKSRVREFINQN